MAMNSMVAGKSGVDRPVAGNRRIPQGGLGCIFAIGEDAVGRGIFCIVF